MYQKSGTTCSVEFVEEKKERKEREGEVKVAERSSFFLFVDAWKGMCRRFVRVQNRQDYRSWGEVALCNRRIKSREGGMQEGERK